MTLPRRFQKLKELEAKLNEDEARFADIDSREGRIADEVADDNRGFIIEARAQVPDLLQALEIACGALRAYEPFNLRFESCGGLVTDELKEKPKEKIYDSGFYNPAREALEQIEKLGVKE